jgi:hypothetical protein
MLNLGGSTITDLHWWGVYAFGNSAPAADNFTIRLFSDAGGAPADVHFFNLNIGNSATRTPTGTQVVGFDIYEYSAVVTPIVLAPGVTYWLSVVNNTAGHPDGWYWAQSNPGGNSHQRQTDAGAWDNSGVELAFNLTDDVALPEPGSLALMALGLVAGRRALKRRKSSLQ